MSLGIIPLRLCCGDLLKNLNSKHRIQVVSSNYFSTDTDIKYGDKDGVTELDK